MRHLSVRYIAEGDPIPRGARIYRNEIPDEVMAELSQWAAGRIPKFGNCAKTVRIVVIVGRQTTL